MKNGKVRFVHRSFWRNFAAMKIHIFNPEHDIALAMHKDLFTAPHTVRQLRRDLGGLAALWADDGDIVVVDDIQVAQESVRHLKRYAHVVRFVDFSGLQSLPVEEMPDIEVCPWGWNRAIGRELVAASENVGLAVPSEDRLETIRKMSNRSFAATYFLPALKSVIPHCVGDSFYCATLEEVEFVANRNGQSVLKAPWSCSGRGVRYVFSEMDDHQKGWSRNVITRQGGIMVEPYYNKVIDFGMEFEITTDGQVKYCGLSLFHTKNGAYVGNVLATENRKREMLSRYVNLNLIDKLCETVISLAQRFFGKKYFGPFGIDMMLVADENGELKVHPCVELNLRRTMGHVALAVSPDEYHPEGVMRIVFENGRYKLRITPTKENLLNTDTV